MSPGILIRQAEPEDGPALVAAPNRRGIRFAERLGDRIESTMPDVRAVDGKGMACLRLGKLID